MKALFTLLFSFSIIISQGQTFSSNPLFAALGKILSKKEFKELADMKCYVASRVQVVSKQNDISFSLILETQTLESIDLREGFLEREPYLSNPILGITSELNYLDTRKLIHESTGVSKLSAPNKDSRHFSFYYHLAGESSNLYFNVYFKKDDADQITVNRISFSKIKE